MDNQVNHRRGQPIIPGRSAGSASNKQPRGYWKDVVVKPSARTFIDALPLLGLWLLIPGCMLLVSSIWQAWPLSNELEDRSPKVATVEFASPDNGQLVLFISYPSKLFLNPPETPSKPFAFWLQYATDTPGPSPTSSITPTVTPEQTSGEQTPSPTSSLVPFPTATPTPTPTPYVVAILPDKDGVTFTDEQGHPVPMRVVLTPSRFEITPEVLYVRPAQAASTALPDEVAVGLAVGNLPMPTGVVPITIQIETNNSAFWRHFGGMVCGSPALIGGLLTAVAGFAVNQWNQQIDGARKEKEKMELEKQVAEKEIHRLGKLARDNYSEAARLYLALMQKTERVWPEPEIHRQLQVTWNQNAPFELQVLMQLWNLRTDELTITVQKIGEVIVLRALEWANEYQEKNLDGDWQEKIKELNELLINYFPELRVKLENRLWHAWLQVWPPFTFWRNEPPAIDTIEDKIRYFREAQNPIGTEQAEDDMLFFHRTGGVSGHYEGLLSLADLEQSESSLVLGASGTGKTASAMTLARRLLLRDRDTFPIYYPTSLQDVNLENVVRITARTIMRYIAIAPYAFLEQDVAGRASIAKLLTCVASGTELIHQLRMAGLPETGVGLKMEQFLTQYAGKNSKFSVSDHSKTFALLSQIHPHEFSKIGLLIDVQEQPWSGVDKQNTERIQADFLTLAQKLNGIGWMTKVFLPTPESSQQPLLKSELFQHHLLQWTDEHLKELLQIRLQLFGDDTLTALCDSVARRRSPNERLIAASGGTPRGLFRKANQLLRRFGENKAPLSPSDLDEILGPYSPAPKTSQ